MATNWETESEEEPKPDWDTSDVTDRNKLLWFICQRIEQGATKEHLLEDEVSIYIKENGLPLFLRWDVEGMIDWAIRKFRPSSDDKQPGWRGQFTLS